MFYLGPRIHKEQKRGAEKHNSRVAFFVAINFTKLNIDPIDTIKVFYTQNFVTKVLEIQLSWIRIQWSRKQRIPDLDPHH